MWFGSWRNFEGCWQQQLYGKLPYQWSPFMWMGLSRADVLCRNSCASWCVTSIKNSITDTAIYFVYVQILTVSTAMKALWRSRHTTATYPAPGKLYNITYAWLRTEFSLGLKWVCEGAVLQAGENVAGGILPLWQRSSNMASLWL